MNNRQFSTIRALIPASDWFAVYAVEEEPFYMTSRLQCIVAGRTIDGYDARSDKFKDGGIDDIAFMEMDSSGLFEDPTNTGNFLAVCHERDITEEMKAHWSELGKAYLEKQNAKAT